MTKTKWGRAGTHLPPAINNLIHLRHAIICSTNNILVNVQSHEHITSLSSSQVCAELITFISMATTISAKRLAHLYGIVPLLLLLSLFLILMIIIIIIKYWQKWLRRWVQTVKGTLLEAVSDHFNDVQSFLFRCNHARYKGRYFDSDKTEHLLLKVVNKMLGSDCQHG